MTFAKFQQKFDTKQVCHMHLFQLKWPAGFCCLNCLYYDYFQINTLILPLLQSTSCVAALNWLTIFPLMYDVLLNNQYGRPDTSQCGGLSLYTP
ncbi:putative membrane protein [Paenibacillus sp. LBL]|nr:putative membrane protein [Paenibacillus sp. LBL]